MDVLFRIAILYLFGLRMGVSQLAIVFSTCELVWLNLSPCQGDSRVRASLLACRSCWPHFRHSKFGFAAWTPRFSELVEFLVSLAHGPPWLLLLSCYRQSYFCCCC